MEANDAAIDCWGILEIMGHLRLAGKMSETRAGLLRIDVPETEGRQGFTRFFGMSSVYSITPTTEETAKLFAERIDPPVNVWDIREHIDKEVRKRLPEPVETWGENLCVYCHENPVDVDAGFDTCAACAGRI